MKPNEYVEQCDGGWRVRGSRVSLDSIVFAFRDGLSPEAIARECFPTLRLEQVYGAIAFYLAHRGELDSFFAGELVPSFAGTDSEFSEKMARARRELLPARS